MEMKKILVPIDGSEPSKNAFKLALALTSKMDSEVILLNVADVNEMTYPVEQFDILTDSYFGKKDMPAGEYKDYRADVFKAANEKGNELTRELVEQIPEGITYTVTTKIGTPGPTIVRAVKELEADIVVMGNSGKGALSSFVTGSVSQYVMHHVECPVTIVK